ncbi:hypothetical protein F4780DRAFT_14335 [Xylariomycetidae sp. FL0641]|nr:hypothetical protein F4780DRAFT_14335 [Xylariomycetidae sp. FL0641]
MQFSSILLTLALSASSVLAAPVVSMTAAVPEMIIKETTHTCNADDTSCTWSFKIDPQTADRGVTECKFEVKGSPASQTDAAGVQCGPYTVGCGWDGSFGAGNGFTTFSVVDNEKKLIAYPSFTDAELKDGKKAADKSFAVSKLG